MLRIRTIHWMVGGCLVLCLVVTSFLSSVQKTIIHPWISDEAPNKSKMVATREENLRLEKLNIPTTDPPSEFVIIESNSTAIFLDAEGSTNHSHLPHWFLEYLTWHRTTLQQINETNWENYQYVLLDCVKADEKCRGTADRLKMVPLLILLAAQTQRLFFIHWSRPAPLEEFLVPSQLNWTLPSWLIDKIQAESIHPRWRFEQEGKVGLYNETDERIIRIFSPINGNDYYDDHRESPNELSFWDVYHDLWHAIFQPSPLVQEHIHAALRELDLWDGSSSTGIRPYVSVHVRSQYVEDTSEDKDEENAIRCASHLQKELAATLFGSDENTMTTTTTTIIPIYVASDTQKVTQRAVEYGRAHNRSVVARLLVNDPWHLDRGGDHRSVADYYDTFVDLYLLSLGQCYTWGRGGYGSWAAVIGHAAQGYCDSSGNHRRRECAFA